MINLEKLLQRIGLNEKEAKIYLTLLNLKESPISFIAKKSNLKRPTVYVILEALEKNGFVSHFKREKVLYYRASDPKLILESERNKIQDLERALPELQSIQSQFEIVPQMSVYQGKNGLIQIMEDTLNTKEELLCWCDVDLAINTILSDYFPTYLEKKIKKNIWLKGIFTHNEGGLRHKKNQVSELREVYLVPKEKFPFKNEINIYDDKVAIISHQDAVGVIIQNKSIADTQKAIFNLAFEYAKLLERDLLTAEDKAYLGLQNKD